MLTITVGYFELVSLQRVSVQFFLHFRCQMVTIVSDLLVANLLRTVSSQKMAIDCNLYLRCEQKF